MLLLSAILVLQQPTRPDSARADTTRPIMLRPTVVRASIAPIAGIAIGSNVPARIAIVSGREIDAWEPRLLVDALSTQAGVSVYDDLGSAYKLNLSTRGFSAGPTVGLPSGVSVFLDGVRQNEPDAQEVNFDLLPMEHIERVELLSGSASLLGPNSLGGAVNLITRRGGGARRADLEIAGGSFGTASAEASVSSPAYYLGAGYQREDGWRAATGAEGYNAFLNLGTHVQLFAARALSRTAGSLPESIFRSSPQTNFTPGDFEDLNVQQASFSTDRPIGRGLGAVTVYARRSGAERFNVNQPPDDDVRARTINGTLGGTADWRWLATRAPLAVRIGVDGGASWVHARIFGEPQDGSPAALTTDVKSPGVTLAFYALADLRAGRALLSLGARYDYVRVPFHDQQDPAGDTVSTFRHLNPRGGITIDLGRGASIYASLGHSFRAPAILELACADPDATCPLPFALGEDPPLRPVRVTTLEVGGRWTRGPVLLTASAYRSAVRDEIFFVAAPNALLAGYFTNIARTRRTGAELSAQVALGEPLVGYANYAYTRATFESVAEIFTVRADSAFAASPLAGSNDVTPGDQIPLVPVHQVKAGVLLRAGGRLTLGAGVRLTGRQWLRGDEANETRPLDAYAVTDARVGYDGERWEIGAIVTNVFDTRAAVFGTFNENRQTGALERFLTPLGARAWKVVVRRSLGGD